jgi:hypothetical protein
MEPLREYTSRQERWRAAEGLLQRQFVRIGNWRLAIAVVAAAVGWLAFGADSAPGWLLAIPAAAFLGLVVWHQRVIRKRDLAARAVSFYDRGLDRLQDRWSGTGATGEEFRGRDHVYADDLDVFGNGSLFELLSRARTTAGEKTLADWLLGPADRGEALARQLAVEELARQLDLREEIALLGEDVRANVHPDIVEQWALGAPAGFSRRVRQLALGLSLASLGTLALFFGQVLPLFPFLVILGCNFGFMFAVRQRVAHVVEPLPTPAQDLGIFALLLARLEAASFGTGKLNEIRADLAAEGRSASARIRRLRRWTELLDSSDHLIVRVIRPVVLWREQCAFAVEQWRTENGAHVVRWLAAVGEFEALSSLAALRFERPAWVFPTLLTTADGEFTARGLQHPLIPPARCVANDVALGGELRLLIISGSNMSGKSTLLRAIGLNTILAWAGAPVAALECGVSALQVGASLRVTDSLQDNRSRFYAEITRLRHVVDLTKGSLRVLFLLDELLSGTNSHDRRIGAAAVVRGLVEAGAIGLITTHDLALANIEQDLGRRAANAHFEDAIIDGKMEFDYRLRPGVVTRSNALELMRAVGLEV